MFRQHRSRDDQFDQYILIALLCVSSCLLEKKSIILSYTFFSGILFLRGRSTNGVSCPYVSDGFSGVLASYIKKSACNYILRVLLCAIADL